MGLGFGLVVKSGDVDQAWYHEFKIVADDHPPAFLFPELRILRVLDGSGVWQIGEKSVFISTGDVVFVNNIENRRFLRVDEKVGLHAEVFSFTPPVFGANTICYSLFYGMRSEIPCISRTDEGSDTINVLLDTLHYSFTEILREKYRLPLFLL